jgi:hypothetical protein
MPREFRSLNSILVILIVCLATRGQDAIRITQPDEIVNRASSQVPSYLSTFRNLISQETKTFTRFSKDGDVKKTKNVVSTFIVYPSARDENRIAEYRNVLSVDGKAVGNPEGRAKDFFERVVRSENSRAELKKIEDESSRYDEIAVNGLTLFEGVPLLEHLRQYFSFKLNGTEKIDGFDTYRIDYEQVRSSPYISIDESTVPSDGKMPVIYELESGVSGPANERLRGTLWIDTNTFQIRREKRQMTIQPENFARRVVAADNEFEYQNSEFGILTPRRITYTSYRVDRKNDASVKEDSIALEYEKFTRPDVEVKSSEVKN